MNDFLLTTTKGYVIDVYRIINTVMGCIVCYVFNYEFVRAKIRYNSKGRYIEVRQHGKYYGRCYLNEL